MNKRFVVVITIAMLAVTSGVAALVIYTDFSRSVKYTTISEKIILLDFEGRFAAVRGEDLGILLEKEGGQEDSVTFPFIFNPVKEEYSVNDMYITIAGHTLVQESECAFIITLNDQISQTANDYIDESAVSWFSVQLNSDFHNALNAGINTITLHGYQAENENFLLYQAFLYIEYQYVA